MVPLVGWFDAANGWLLRRNQPLVASMQPMLGCFEATNHWLLRSNQPLVASEQPTSGCFEATNHWLLRSSQWLVASKQSNRSLLRGSQSVFLQVFVSRGTGAGWIFSVPREPGPGANARDRARGTETGGPTVPPFI